MKPTRQNKLPWWVIQREIQRELEAMRMDTPSKQQTYLEHINMEQVHERAWAVYKKTGNHEKLIRQLYDRLPPL